jgi:LmbE family N-acetylglucosaminyl deacetylase
VNVLAVAAHADDETLGCGGSLLRHRASGDHVHWLVVSEAGPGGRWPAEALTQKESALQLVAEAYGVREPTRLRHAAGRLDQVAVGELMEGIAATIARVRPELVYVVAPGDAHTDHQETFRAASAVLKPFHLKRLGVRQLLVYETLSSTEAAPLPSFSPNVFVDVSEWLERKLEVMAMYGTETQPEPLPRSPSAIRALARFRGATIGVEYAEAFMLIRAIA